MVVTSATYILAASIEGPPCEICHFKVLYYSKEKYSAAMTCIWWSRPIYWQQVWRDLLVKDVTLKYFIISRRSIVQR